MTLKNQSFLIALLSFAAVSRAQFMLPQALAPSSKQTVALSADINIQLTSNSVFGTFTQSQAGKYWRSSDGKTRQDTSFGSVITDSKARTVIYLNHAAKQATVIHMAPVTTPSATPTPSAPSPPAATSAADLGQKVVAGYEVQGKQIVTTTGNQPLQVGSVTTEMWTAPALQLPLFIKQRSSRGTSVQQFDNIQLNEPDPSLFTVPAGYAVTEKTADGSTTASVAIAPSH
jgi:hypothetical protein